MKLRFSALLLATLLLLNGCYLPISGRVIDAETRQPIEGAAVFVEWMEEHGFGLTYHTVYKVAETETSNKGEFSLPGAYSPFVDPPRMVIYKNGYIVWNNEYKFPKWERRNDFSWKRGTFELEKFITRYPILEDGNKWSGLTPFIPTYTHYSHVEFIDSFIWRSGRKIKTALDVEAREARQDAETPISFTISARIIDVDTHEGIAGAVVEFIGGGTGYPSGLGGASSTWRSSSDQQGNVLLTGRAPLLARPPSIVVKKNGYYIWNCNDKFEEHDLWEKLRAGFVFELKSCEKEKGLQTYLGDHRCVQ